jgi:hypothetical protein
MINQQGRVYCTKVKLEALFHPKPSLIRAIEIKANLEQQDIYSKKRVEHLDKASTTQEHPTIIPRFTTRTSKNQEEQDQKDQFEITINEITGKTDVTQMGTPG